MNGRYCRSCHTYHPLMQQAAPWKPTWTDHAKDAGETLLGVVVLLTLMFGIPLLLFLVAS